MKKRLLSVLLSIVCLSNIITPFSVNAADYNLAVNNTQQTSDTETSDSYKTNFNFTQTSDLTNVEYTYEENNKTYLVKENSNEDLSVINTDVYEIGTDTNILVNQYVTTLVVNNNILTVTKSDGNNTICDTINLKENNKTVKKAISRASGTYNGGLQYDYINHKYYTLWFSTGSSNGSNKITVYSLTAIIAIIGSVTGAGGAAVSAIAQIILSENLPIVYWTKSYQELWEVTYPGRQYIGNAVGEKIHTSFYRDSSRSSYIGSEDYEYHDPVYWPSDMNF